VSAANSIGDDGAKALAIALNTNSTLTKLDLHSSFSCRAWTDYVVCADNKIGANGSKALAKMLKTNSTLMTLGLDCALSLSCVD